MQSKVVTMHTEFGLPVEETFKELKAKISSSLWFKIYSKQLSLKNIKVNARKVSGKVIYKQDSMIQGVSHSALYQAPLRTILTFELLC